MSVTHYGLLTCLAVLVASCVRGDERGPAMISGLLILSSWGLFVSAWGDVSPAGLMHDIGVEADHVDMWSFTDALVSMLIIAMAFQFWWGWALWGLLICQIILHVQSQHGGAQFQEYSRTLDLLFLGQLAVLFLIGGKSCGDRVLNFGRNVRDVLCPTESAQSQE